MNHSHLDKDGALLKLAKRKNQSGRKQQISDKAETALQGMQPSPQSRPSIMKKYCLNWR